MVARQGAENWDFTEYRRISGGPRGEGMPCPEAAACVDVDAGWTVLGKHAMVLLGWNGGWRRRIPILLVPELQISMRNTLFLAAVSPSFLVQTLWVNAQALLCFCSQVFCYCMGHCSLLTSQYLHVSVTSLDTSPFKAKTYSPFNPRS